MREIKPRLIFPRISYVMEALSLCAFECSFENSNTAMKPDEQRLRVLAPSFFSYYFPFLSSSSHCYSNFPSYSVVVIATLVVVVGFVRVICLRAFCIVFANASGLTWLCQRSWTCAEASWLTQLSIACGWKIVKILQTRSCKFLRHLFSGSVS